MAFCRYVCNGEKYRYYLHYKWHFAGVFVMVKSTAITYTTNGLSEIHKKILRFCLLVFGYCLKLNKTNKYSY